MTPRAATRFLLWFGEKSLAGDEPTEGEMTMFREAREVSLAMAHKFMRLKPEDYKYTPGVAFGEDLR